MSTDVSADPAVLNLQTYLRIRSVHPNVNYDECLAYLRGQAQQLGLSVQEYTIVPKKPILVMTWTGSDPALPSILLNSHMDVVPVFEKSWKHPPFAAEIEDGVVYGRGAQDMKSVAVQYIEAVRRLKQTGFKPKRTIHLSFVPDEEVGGRQGMGEFVKSEHFRALNVGFSLDEGLASASSEYLVYNAERSIWHISITCPGKSGHGSLLLPDNCGEKVRYIIDKFMDLRQESKKKMEDNPELTAGDVTSVNLTILSGGIQNNVVPEKFVASFDLRLALSVNHQEFENMIKKWCSEAGPGVTYDFDQKDAFVAATPLDNGNPYWLAFKATTDELKLPVKICTFPGGTDSRYIRELNIPALGFTPIINTEPGLHQHNESLKLDVFMRGIQIYEKIIPALANV
ncbi:aminoacylase-1-like [Pectinophora gossypiella]|uniref:aminoacylase-1-like n=1 Tax=Pectinophora gossypiella TaxID=13191 RepID=UPI00214EF6FA|nr:aminoacylase-1-like [Pectinophora gossypiella]